jgi:hypothetical protein
MMSSFADVSGGWFQVNGLLYSSCSVHILLGIRVNNFIFKALDREKSLPISTAEPSLQTPERYCFGKSTQPIIFLMTLHLAS